MRVLLWLVVFYLVLGMLIAKAAEAAPLRHAKRGNIPGYVCPMIYHGPSLPATKWNILKGVCV